jgi:arginine-tRNA-protein transferase
MSLSNEDETFLCWSASPSQMDRLWAEGWRHFGIVFTRYCKAFHGDSEFTVLPLRIDLGRFRPTRSQKRILAKNHDLRTVLRSSFVDDEKQALFEKHRLRFVENVPTSLFNFLSTMPGSVPCTNLELCVYLGARLSGVTFLDIGVRATSAVYAMFDPAEVKRSLGIFMMLQSIRYSLQQGCRYYYPGYAYREPFAYDYKKRFIGLESLDWTEGWKPFHEMDPALEELGSK